MSLIMFIISKYVYVADILLLCLVHDNQSVACLFSYPFDAFRYLRVLFSAIQDILTYLCIMACCPRSLMDRCLNSHRSCKVCTESGTFQDVKTVSVHAGKQGRQTKSRLVVEWITEKRGLRRGRGGGMAGWQGRCRVGNSDGESSS